MKTMPLDWRVAPVTGTALIWPVQGFSVPGSFAGNPGAGQVAGALLALQGVTAARTDPSWNRPGP
jgi:hypothetical protein